MIHLESKFFKVREIIPGTRAIMGAGMEFCYLLEGQESALLIDALTGAGNLRAFVRELTDLPVTLANTHGHIDHAGGNFDFESCYIHADDIPMIYEIEVEGRMEYVKMMSGFNPAAPKVRTDDFTPARALKTFPVAAGHVFDLGKRRIEVIAVPGHTRGSIVFLDPEARLLFSGDAINQNTLVFLPYATTIEEYRAGLGGLKIFQPRFDALYGGHSPAAYSPEIVDEGIELCDEIMRGTDDAEPGGFMDIPCFYGKKKNERFERSDGKTANIAYRKDAIFKK
jgi:glyoxylase-like metal-dependent hydrolase (beta-lactamase superfamily II)